MAPPGAPAKIPSWLSLGQIISGIGALLIFIGFLFGDLAVSNIGTTSNYQSELETFFLLTGIGILLAIGGWLFHDVWPKFQARPRPAPVYTPPVAPSPAPVAAAPAPPPAAPAAAVPAPLCPTCGKPTTYIAQYGRYYCYSCPRYV